VVSKKVSDSVSKKIGFEKKVSDSVLEKFGIKKSIGFGIEEIWYRKKVSDSVSFRFWVSSHTDEADEDAEDDHHVEGDEDDEDDKDDEDDHHVEGKGVAKAIAATHESESHTP
jgi:hypothetical protein